MNKLHIFILFLQLTKEYYERVNNRQPAMLHISVHKMDNDFFLSTAVAVAMAATQYGLFRHDFRFAKFLRELMAIVIVMVMGLLVSSECDVCV